MKNPLLPDKIYDFITDELAEMITDTDSPDYILTALKQNGKIPLD